MDIYDIIQYENVKKMTKETGLAFEIRHGDELHIEKEGETIACHLNLYFLEGWLYGYKEGLKK